MSDPGTVGPEVRLTVGKRSGKKARASRVRAESKCRDCGKAAVLSRVAFFKAAKPRCVACGGMMDYGGSWYRTR